MKTIIDSRLGRHLPTTGNSTTAPETFTGEPKSHGVKGYVTGVTFEKGQCIDTTKSDVDLIKEEIDNSVTNHYPTGNYLLSFGNTTIHDINEIMDYARLKFEKAFISQNVSVKMRVNRSAEVIVFTVRVS